MSRTDISTTEAVSRQSISQDLTFPHLFHGIFAQLAVYASATCAIILISQWGIARENHEKNDVTNSAISAAVFLNTLGVNTHLSWTKTPYVNLAQIGNHLNYLGIHNLRDDFRLDAQTYDAVGAMMALGFKFDLISGGDMATFLGAAHKLGIAHPGGLIAIEGPNEVDGWRVNYAGLTGYTAAIKYQQALFSKVKSDAVLVKIPVYNLTVAAVAASKNLGDLSPYADYANVHLYYGAGQPAYGWSPNDGAYSWSSWITSGRLAAPGRPIVVTETGASATPAWGGGVDENTQARQILNSLMDAARTGVSATYIYELVDGMNNGPADEKSHYGLFRWDGSPRPAAVAVHNFTHILGDGSHMAAGDTGGALDYVIRGVPQWGGHLVFQEGDGAKDIVVWAEPDIWNETAKTAIAPPNTPITVDLATPAKVSIYDPLRSSAPVQMLGTTSHVSLNVTDHPLIVEITKP
ncbi:MAG: hypothetical protein JWO72_2572 [Caulobacteraceae bacterium]|nr:hypothetical protein [Caulobacteraceae bacterium]